MKQQVFISLIVGLLSVSSSAKAQTPRAGLQESLASPSFMPSGGFVPDAATAKKIAEAVWLPIYGKKVLSEKPYQATLNNKGV